MNIEVIISTMNLKDWKILIERMNVQTDCIVVNQTNYNKIEDYKFGDISVKVVSVNEKGLSRSRNLGLSLIDKNIDFVYFADDDIKINNNSFKKITNRNIDFYLFSCVVDGNIKKPKYNINFINSMKLSSIQIVYNVKFLKEKNIKFDNRFGSGTRFGSGEENIIIFDMLRGNAKSLSFDDIIANTENLRPSTWFKGFNEEFLFNRGAIFTRMSKKYSILLVLQFSIRKYKLYKKENIGFFRALKAMLNGRKYFLELDNE
ncbi:hypothetical protein O6B34_04915 [Campylobacter ureolyticus]|uniref:hypothetical protein n=1 Tax=Campylobacter ureolyticus TaxID=827 RepID=UPI0022B3DF37|nr:hypothetical protein [Campylobacter ureolyticus]MCZ6105402.1 hypothetical protein [Campylobacter ureolyticus]